uniref:Slc15a-3 n=1 Tax=Schmidtea mediterranea TaxID=79327 RepID=A0A0H3YJ33_SCHMD|nr:slc15a-3 [Schmidtea mediterranea]
MKFFRLSGNLFENFKFPLPCWIILIHEVLERFSFYGMKGILAIYLNLYLGFNDNHTTVLYHLFVGLSYLSPIFGAIIADNYLGRFYTVIVVGLVYLLGHVLMTLTAIQKNILGPLIGMSILAIGSGGIKSSVAAFGGDQVPTGNDMMIEKYFSLFYTAINLGAFAAQFVTPILRKDISCVDGQCYPLGFGVPAFIFLVTYIIFISGKRTYTIVPRSKSVLSKFSHCIYVSIRNYIKEKKISKYKSILEYAQPEYSMKFIDDCKKALRIMIVFAPIPVFWALYDQQGSRWTLQAKYMNGKIVNSYNMKPEQIQSINALLIIGLIPVFDFIIYPFFGKFNILVKPTSRLVASYIVAALSFIIAGFLQIYLIRGQNIEFNTAGSKLLIINSINDCKLNLTIDNRRIMLASNGSVNLDLNPGLVQVSMKCVGYQLQVKNLTLSQYKMTGGYIYKDNNARIDIKSYFVKSPDSQNHIRFLNPNDPVNIEMLRLAKDHKNFTIDSNYSSLDVGVYEIYCSSPNYNEYKCGNVDVTPGLVGSLMMTSERKLHFWKEFEPNLIHMLWQMPQYILITCAEILCSITSLSFAYSESPDSMKSLMQAIYLITIFGGNIIVVFVAGVGSKLTQTTEFFLFATLVLIAGCINWILIRGFWISKDNFVENQNMDN